MTGYEWCCPFCDRYQVVTEENQDSYFKDFRIGKTVHGEVGIHYYAVRCSNPRCNEVYLRSSIHSAEYNSAQRRYELIEQIDSWTLRPDSYSKIQPEYIPSPLREDYQEACSIRSRSPKAAATLARRCLQGMIRDFCRISKSRLIDEIETLRDQVDAGTAPKGVEAETVDAIDAVRNVGNIGAHMEKDISLIVEVDPGEAQTLIELIEMLFKEWYIARHDRQERLARIQLIAAEKKAQLAEQKALAAVATPAITDQSTS